MFGTTVAPRGLNYPYYWLLARLDMTISRPFPIALFTIAGFGYRLVSPESLRRIHPDGPVGMTLELMSYMVAAAPPALLVSALLGLATMPLTRVARRDGKIVRIHMGFLKEWHAQLKEMKLNYRRTTRWVTKHEPERFITESNAWPKAVSDAAEGKPGPMTWLREELKRLAQDYTTQRNY